jgi:hypothetical protein
VERTDKGLLVLLIHKRTLSLAYKVVEPYMLRICLKQSTSTYRQILSLAYKEVSEALSLHVEQSGKSGMGRYVGVDSFQT